MKFSSPANYPQENDASFASGNEGHARSKNISVSY